MPEASCIVPPGTTEESAVVSVQASAGSAHVAPPLEVGAAYMPDDAEAGFATTAIAKIELDIPRRVAKIPLSTSIQNLVSERELVLARRHRLPDIILDFTCQFHAPPPSSISYFRRIPNQANSGMPKTFGSLGTKNFQDHQPPSLKPSQGT